MRSLPGASVLLKKPRRAKLQRITQKKAKERKSRGRAGITLKASERKGEEQRQKAGGNEKGQSSNGSRETPESKEEKGTAGSRGSKRRKNDAEEPCMGWGSGGRSLFSPPSLHLHPKISSQPRFEGASGRSWWRAGCELCMSPANHALIKTGMC